MEHLLSASGRSPPPRSVSQMCRRLQYMTRGEELTKEGAAAVSGIYLCCAYGVGASALLGVVCRSLGMRMATRPSEGKELARGRKGV